MSESDNSGQLQLSLIEKLVAAVLIGLLGWMAVTVQQVNVDVAVIKAEIATANRDRFTDQEGQRLADRIQRVEDRIETLEEKAGK